MLSRRYYVIFRRFTPMLMMLTPRDYADEARVTMSCYDITPIRRASVDAAICAMLLFRF